MNHAERFWAKVDKSGDCWRWTAHKDSKGYGRFYYKGDSRLAHRVAWELSNGPVPDGLMLDHACRMTSCVNSLHLRLVDNKRNQENLAVERNSGGMRGANFVKTSGLWRARVKHHKRAYTSGPYTTQGEAAEAARQLRLSLFTHNDADRMTP